MSAQLESRTKAQDRGVSVAWLKRFLSEALARRTKDDVIDFFWLVKSTGGVLDQTAKQQGSLWALVPEAERGAPAYFLSHT